MKKFFILIASLFVLASCSNQEELSQDKGTPAGKKSNFETFAIYGETHNALLHYVSTNFSEPQSDPATKEEALDYVLSVQKKGIADLPISDNDKTLLAEGLETYKRFYVTDDLMEVIQPTLLRTSVDEDDEEEVTTEEIRALIKEAYDTGSIDEFEYESFMLLIDYVLANASGVLSDADFAIKVDELIAQWDVKYADVDFSELEVQQDEDSLTTKEAIMMDLQDAPKGALGGVVLNVSQSSLDYWGNELPIAPPTRAVQAIVGADIAGAVVGACTSAVESYATTGKVNWRNVAWKTASGAVIGSTGIVGKLGKWISKFL